MDRELELLKSKGLSSPYAVNFMPHSVVDGKVVVDYEKASRQLAQDSAQITATNIGVPSAFVTYIDPKIVEILYAVQNATKIFTETKKGDWADKTYQFPVQEVAGGVTPYSDFTENVSSDLNWEFPERQNFLFETVMKYGDLEESIASKAQLQLASGKQKACATILAQAHNKFYLYGVAGKRIYGLLNDPNLPDSETPYSVNGASTWADKVSANPDQVANIVYNDISKLWASLTARNGGNIDANSPIVLAVSNAVTHYLIMPNSFGLTARDMLKSNFPNLKIVELPELSTDAGEMLYMTVPEVLGQATAQNAFSEKMRMGRVVAELSSYKQKAIGGTYGCVIYRPCLVATMLGI